MRVGEIIAGRFRIEAPAGAGAMGVVYKAIDLAIGRWVAVKLVTLQSDEALARFEREVTVLATLRHPNIVEYIAHGRTAAGEPYLAMAWLEGETLKSALESGRLTYVEIVDVAIGIAAALTLTHAHGIVHRDLKPANVFLVGRSAADVRVVDFGIARLRKTGASLTGTGEMLGSPGYMSPEQARGSRSLDAKSDLFSLGAILFRCLTGRLPFERDDTLSMLLALTTSQAPPVASMAPGAPPRLASLVDALLASEPSARPEEAARVHWALSEARSEATVASPPKASPWPPPSRQLHERAAAVRDPRSHTNTSPRKVWLVLAAAVAFIMLSLAVIALVLFLDVDRPNSVSEESKPKKKRKARETSESSTPKIDCPGALGCVPYELNETTRADGFAIIEDMLAYGRTFQPNGQFSASQFYDVSDGLVNLDSSMVTVDMTLHVTVQVKRHSMSAWAHAIDDRPSPTPGCSLSVAYKAAVAAGFPAHVESNITLGGANDSSTMSFVIVKPFQRVLLDSVTCNVMYH